MDFRKFRRSATTRWNSSDPDQLAELTRKGELNEFEREFVAEIVLGEKSNKPRRKRGRPPQSRNAIRAGLIRFWLRDVCRVKKEDAILKAVENELGVTKRMVRKYFAQLDNPKTEAERISAALFVATLNFGIWT